jgi:hypothetical protein
MAVKLGVRVCGACAVCVAAVDRSTAARSCSKSIVHVDAMRSLERCSRCSHIRTAGVCLYPHLTADVLRRNQCAPACEARVSHSLLWAGCVRRISGTPVLPCCESVC